MADNKNNRIGIRLTDEEISKLYEISKKLSPYADLKISEIIRYCLNSTYQNIIENDLEKEKK